MATIGLVARPDIGEARELARKFIDWAKAERHELVIEQHTANELGVPSLGIPAEAIPTKANPIIALGGDGTLIGVARYASAAKPTFIGVKFGHLGFLTEITPSEVFTVVESVLRGKAELGTRGLLRAEVHRDDEVIFSSHAANDAVVIKGAVDPLVDLDVFVNDEAVMRLRGDGLIVSTPTGSTAYSLAAGGSIVHPALAAILVTPIFAHSLTVRPFVLPADYKITLRAPDFSGTMHLSVDGQVSCSITPADTIVVSKAPVEFSIALSPTRSYFDILRRKLNWGIANNMNDAP